MRHGKAFNHLGRKKGHRTALLRNLSGSLIRHKRIITTLAKAKALRAYIEPLITKSKNNTTHSRRIVFTYLNNKEAVSELFGSVAEKVGTTKSYISKIENNIKEARISTLQKIVELGFGGHLDLSIRL